MGAGLTNCIDSTSTYFANLISKSGRNEVQIYSINKESESTTLDQVLIKVELEADENILDAVWIDNEQKNKKRGKKRSNGNAPVPSSNDDSQVLAVLVETGDIIIFSPHNDVSSRRISGGSKFIGLTASLESAWAYSQNDFHQISLETNTTVKQITLTDDVSIAQAIHPKPKSKKSQIIIGNQLQVIEPSLKKNPVRKFEGSSEDISKIVQSTTNSEIFYTLDKSANLAQKYDMATSTAVSNFTVSGVKDIFCISNGGKDTLMATTSEGVQYFDSDSKTDEPTGSIRTNFEAQGIYISSVYFMNNVAVGVWYDGNEPKIANLPWDSKSSGDIQVSIDYSVKNNDSFESNNLISMPESADINNLSSDVLYKQLLKLLLASKLDEGKVIRLCETNDNPKNIKETVKLFFQSEDSSLVSNNLFQIISDQVASDPSKKSSLSIWLKWLLLAHGGSIATQQSERLNNLHTGISGAMKVLPHLVALQGRLKLLQSQGNLRSQQSQEIDDVEMESEDESAGVQTTETSIVYANGENDEDDFEDVEGELIEDGEEVVEDEDN